MSIPVSHMSCRDAALEMFSKKLSGNSEIEDALRRLDRLVLDEVCMAGAVALQRLDRLERNLDLFMGDAQRLLCSLIQPTPQIDGAEPMRNISQAQGMLDLRSMFVTITADTSHDSGGDKRDG